MIFFNMTAANGSFPVTACGWVSTVQSYLTKYFILEEVSLKLSIARLHLNQTFGEVDVVSGGFIYNQRLHCCDFDCF